jgi:hypothetical protein
VQPLGIMVYGYSADQSDVIRRSFDRLFSSATIVISASGREEMKVMDILAQGPRERFDEEQTRILVFLGFTQEQVRQALQDFPSEGNLPRPIFCTLTEQNIHWPLSRLVEHLTEEHNRRKA